MDADASDVERQLWLLQSRCEAGDGGAVVAEADRLLATEPGLDGQDRAFVLLMKAFVLEDRAAAIECVLAAREQLGEPEDDAGHALLADAIYRQAGLTLDDGDAEEGARLLDGLLERYQEDPPEGALKVIVDARMLRASAWHDLGRHDAAIAEYDAIVEAYGSEVEVGIKMTVADTLLAQAIALRLQSKYVSAMDALAELVNRLEDETDPELRRRVVTALCELGYAAETLQRPKQADQFYKVAIDNYGEDEDEETARLIAWARDALER